MTSYMNRRHSASRRAAVVLLTLGLATCSDATEPGDPPPAGSIVKGEVLIPNPTGYAPLTARVELETSVPVAVSLRVEGRHGPESDVRHEFDGSSRRHEIPVLGLYEGYENHVDLTLYDSQGNELEVRSYTVDTPPPNPNLPEITIDRAEPAAMVEGMTLVSYFGNDGQLFPNRAFIFDRWGDVRWLLDFEGHPMLGDLSFDVGVERLANGNLYFGSQQTDQIYEVDMLGQVANSWSLPGFGFHHEALEKPDGNFLVSVHNRSASTVEDHVIEIDRATGAVVNLWDLRQSLDPERRTWSDRTTDWAHVNAVAYDERDDTIIVSARHQGVVKLTRDNQVVWVLAPHRGWQTAGDGTDLSGLLLQPLDAAGALITDPAVLSGDANYPDFEWPWYQHATKLMPNGDLLLFDNGANRNYTGQGPYSRAVEFSIDADAGTVQQVWSYGKERGAETYSRIVSDVDYRSGENHIFFSPGAVEFGGIYYGKVVEIDRETGKVVFEATIIPPEPFHIVTFHRTERLSLYPTSEPSSR